MGIGHRVGGYGGGSYGVVGIGYGVVGTGYSGGYRGGRGGTLGVGLVGWEEEVFRALAVGGLVLALAGGADHLPRGFQGGWEGPR